MRPAGTVFEINAPLDLRRTLAPLGSGVGPTTRVDHDGWWRAVRSPEGPATLRLRRVQAKLEATGWGPGGEWAVRAAPGMAGLMDDDSGFRPDHPVVRELARRLAGVRLPRTGQVFESLLPTIVAQKVTGSESRRSMDLLVRRFSTRAPGPAEGLMLPPDPARLASVPYYDLHPLGIEKRRADTIRRAAAKAAWLEEAAGLTAEEAMARLRLVPGIGEWTAANVVILTHGAPDLVAVGDFHLPSLVAWNLAGESRATDERMLELLEGFRPHRGRVIRLLEAAGQPAPARGPRMPLRDFAGS